MELKSLGRSKRLQIITLLVGAIAGLLYWKYVGCKTGTCPLKSVWYWTMLWGAVFGYLVGDISSDFIQKMNVNKKEEK